jgi:hypothetical protein
MKDDSPLLAKGTQSPTSRLYVCVVLAMISSYLFGYNTGIIAGAILKIEETFSIDDLHKGLLVIQHLIQM